MRLSVGAGLELWRENKPFYCESFGTLNNTIDIQKVKYKHTAPCGESLCLTKGQSNGSVFPKLRLTQE